MMYSKIRESNSGRKDSLLENTLICLSYLSLLYAKVSITTWIMLGIVFILSLLYVVRNRIVISGINVVWIPYIIWIGIGLGYTNDFTYATGYFLKVIILSMSLWYVPTTNIKYKTIRFLLIVVSIGISSILLEPFAPNIISLIRKVMLVDQLKAMKIDATISSFSSRYGVFPDLAVSAFFAATGVGIGICYLSRKKTMKSGLWFLASIIALVLTNKRGPMLSTLVASLVIYIVYSSMSIRKKIMLIVSLTSMVLLGYYLLNYNQIFINWFQRINSNDYSNMNRLYLYETMWENIKVNPLLGSGTKSTRAFFNGTDGHNIYLSTLNENGIVGLGLLLIAFITGFKTTLRAFRYFRADNSENINEQITVFCMFLQVYIICYGMTGNPLSNLYSLSAYYMAVGIPIRQYQKSLNSN